MDLKTRDRKIIQIGDFAPTDDTAVEMKEVFYDTLKPEIKKVRNRTELIIMGDINGQIGEKLQAM